MARTIHQSLDGGALSSAALNAAFSYESPTVASVTSCSTGGGTVGVYGTNFGNVKRDFDDVSDSVTIATVALTAVVVYNDTYLEVGSVASDHDVIKTHFEPSFLGFNGIL
jgi:hypothetical protein